MKMSHLRLGVAIAATLGLGVHTASARDLQVGVVPNVSAQLILSTYQPFRAYLERETARPVAIVTAPDFKQFHKRTMAGDYDLVVTAANLARVAEVDGGLRPVATYEPRISGVLVQLKSHRITGLEALRGKTVAATNPQSLVALKFGHWIRARGLAPGVDFSLAHARTEDGLDQLLIGGLAPIAVMSAGEFRSLREKSRQLLEIHSEFVSVPGFVILTARHLPVQDSDRLAALILAFPAGAEGEKFLGMSFVRTIRPIAANELSAVDDVIDETRALMR